MTTTTPSPRRTRRRRRGQRGFTLVEVLVAIVVFAIAIVGLVAIEGRSVEAQRASSMLREAERVAQESMADLQSRSFVQLLTYDFAGTLNPSLPYDDLGLDPTTRMFDYRRPPADLDASTTVVGSLRNTYLVFRTVSWVTDPLNPPSSNPPVLPDDLPLVNALVLQVTVVWIDDTNSAMPPPADLTLDEVTLNMIDPTDTDFAPWVGSVQLRTVRANDTVVLP
ncbi:MAG: type II secretion system GspH family protein [Nannocystaceae bacterium]|nr:type II secretion system GspH family protein [Nannocystaceae bacterium]